MNVIVNRLLSSTCATTMLVAMSTGCGGGGAQALLPSSSPALVGKAAVALSNVEAAYPNGVPAAVPGTIDFDNYDTGGEGVAYHTTVTANQGGQYRQDGVGIAASTNAGGGNGFYVGWNEPGDWYRYTVNVQMSATYSVAFRVASGIASGVAGTFHVEDQNGKNLTGALQVPATGSWNANWVTVNATMALPAGASVLKVVIDSSHWFNLNFMTLSTSATPAPTATPAEATYPSGTPWPIAGSIDFDNYDTGGEGVGYHTKATTNQGGAYRHDGVSIGPAFNAGGGNGFFVGWNDLGNWYRYTVNVQTGATYTIAIRVASAAGATGSIAGTFHIEDQSGKNLTGTVRVPATGSWDSTWVTVNATAALSAGANVLKVVIDNGSYNLNSMTFTLGTPTPAPTVTPTAIPTGPAPPWVAAAPSGAAFAKYLAQHNAQVAAIRAAQPALVFLGDSITARWRTGPGLPVWTADYAPRNSFDLGVEGDLTQGVLWRIANHELDNINPKAVVLLIGTNDISAGWSAADVARGVVACVSAIRAAQPTTNILLISVLPRNGVPTNPGRVNAAATDAILAGTTFGAKVTYLDLSPRFVQPDGTLTPGFFGSDNLHPLLPGYQAWSTAQDPLLHTFGL